MVEWPLRAGVKVEEPSQTRALPGKHLIPMDGLVLSGNGAAANFLKAANTGDAVCVRST